MRQSDLWTLSAALLVHLLSVKGSALQSDQRNQKRGIIFPGAESSEPSEKRGSQSCTTPSGRPGECVLITDCQELWKQRDFKLLRRSLCGFEGEQPKVCCPVVGSLTPRPLPEIDENTSSMKANANGSRRPLGGIIPAPGATRNPPTNAEGRASSETGAPISTLDLEVQRSGTRSIKDFLPTECGRNRITIRRIVGGQESVVGAWPWMAAILLTRRGIRSTECGGALVTPKHVITAAHCTVDSRRGTTLRASSLTVRLGEHDLERDDDGASPIDVGVKTIIKHENFIPRTFQNDIAMLELSAPVEFKDNIAPLCLPYDTFGNDDLARRNAFVAGWGTTSFSGPSSSKLQEVQLRIWNNSECKEVFKNDVPITNLSLCAGDGDKDSCRGDSGGPLMLPHLDGKFYMVGIVSFGKKCAEPGIPGVYTRVTSFLDWIERKIRATL